MENSISHPSIYIEAEDVTTIRNTAADAEQLGMLHPDQLTIVYQQKWFRLLVPQVYGGVQITLPELVRLQEAISWADGSMGWVVTLCSGAGWFGGFLSPQIAQQVFNDVQVCLAGSGAVSGTATITPNGYILNGTWNYASGAHHATHITANCTIKKEDGETILDQENKPLVLPFIVDKKDVTLLPTWKYMGMVATGSHSFHIKNLEIPADRAFKIDAGHTTVDGELYKYPFLQLAYATLAVNLSGMAIHFTDLCETIFAERKARVTGIHAALLQEILTEQTGKLQLARMNFFTAVDASWSASQDIDRKLHAVSEASLALAKQAQHIVNVLYPYCGLRAASPDTAINRVWRDLHTASQHALLTFGT